jgi:hypothetical protein
MMSSVGFKTWWFKQFIRVVFWGWTHSSIKLKQNYMTSSDKAQTAQALCCLKQPSDLRKTLPNIYPNERIWINFTLPLDKMTKNATALTSALCIRKAIKLHRTSYSIAQNRAYDLISPQCWSQLSNNSGHPGLLNLCRIPTELQQGTPKQRLSQTDKSIVFAAAEQDNQLPASALSQDP